MAGGTPLTQQAARLWTDPAKRAEIVTMYADGISLIDMCDRLGLGPAVDADGLRDVIRNLNPQEVDVIRDAFLAEATATPGPGANFPVDCRVDDGRPGVRVVREAADRGAVGPIARIEPA
jgi:hypothetical protein